VENTTNGKIIKTAGSYIKKHGKEELLLMFSRFLHLLPFILPITDYRSLITGSSLSSP